MDSQDSPWPKLGGNHHFPFYNIICAWPWGLHPNVIFSQDSQVETPEIPKIRTPITVEVHNFYVDFRSRCGLKKSCSLHQKFSNNIWHATYTQVNKGDSRLLLIWSQIGNLIPDLSFAITYVLSTQMGHASSF
jgi:hypothetical protein